MDNLYYLHTIQVIWTALYNYAYFLWAPANKTLQYTCFSYVWYQRSEFGTKQRYAMKKKQTTEI